MRTPPATMSDATVPVARTNSKESQRGTARRAFVNNVGILVAIIFVVVAIAQLGMNWSRIQKAHAIVTSLLALLVWPLIIASIVGVIAWVATRRNTLAGTIGLCVILVPLTLMQLAIMVGVLPKDASIRNLFGGSSTLVTTNNPPNSTSPGTQTNPPQRAPNTQPTVMPNQMTNPIAPGLMNAQGAGASRPVRIQIEYNFAAIAERVSTEFPLAKNTLNAHAKELQRLQDAYIERSRLVVKTLDDAATLDSTQLTQRRDEARAAKAAADAFATASKSTRVMLTSKLVEAKLTVEQATQVAGQFTTFSMAEPKAIAAETVARACADADVMASMILADASKWKLDIMGNPVSSEGTKSSEYRMLQFKLKSQQRMLTSLLDHKRM